MGRWCSAPTTSRCRAPGRRWRSTCSPRSISARLVSRRACARSTIRACRSGYAAGSPTRPPSPHCLPSGATAARPRPSRCSTASPARGPGGAGRAATSTARAMRARSSTSCAACSRASTPRPTRRSGSTPACTGPMASTVLPRATTSPTTTAARCSPPPPPTSGRSRTPASSRASPTIWSIRAASWICGCARRACSSTAPAPAPTSPVCAARTSRSRAAASRPA